MQEVLVESMEFEVNGGNNSNFNTHDVVDDNDNYKKYYDVDVDHSSWGLDYDAKGLYDDDNCKRG